MISRPTGDEPSEFRQAMESLRDGDTDAAWYLVEKYESDLRRVIRRKLDSRMRAKFDSVDFAQMVWASFFHNPSRFGSFQEPTDLLRFLVEIAKNKVIDELRRRHTRKYDLGKEQQSMNDSQVGDAFYPRHGDTPSQVAIARERWDEMMELESERNREIVRLRLSGMSFDEIAEELDINEKTARRIVGLLTDPEEN